MSPSRSLRFDGGCICNKTSLVGLASLDGCFLFVIVLR